MVNKPYAAPISELHQSISDILHNLVFIQKELPTLELAGNLRGDIINACQKFEWTLHDIRKEINILEDKLEIHSGEVPADSGIVNPNLKATMELIECWLTEEVHAMHGIVRKLWERGEVDENLRIVSILVSESSANILNNSVKIKAALRDIATHLA